jgi:hypothetical protein
MPKPYSYDLGEKAIPAIKLDGWGIRAVDEKILINITNIFS